MLKVTKFDERQCHKWAFLLRERQEKLNRLQLAMKENNSTLVNHLFSEIFYGVASGKQADPGMTGSLLYHMAMITKMETENNLIKNEFMTNLDRVIQPLWKFYSDFVSDVEMLVKERLSINFKNISSLPSKTLTTNDKIQIFADLNKNTEKLKKDLVAKKLGLPSRLNQLFKKWVKNIVKMRLWQEYETIKGLLLTSELAKNLGTSQLREFMKRNQEKFGEETVKIALEVTLKVGLPREKLQAIMLSDHFINYSMDITQLSGNMQFFNCPIFGSHKYISDQLAISEEISALFCTHFCFAHAKAMLESVLPFTFKLWQPKRIATHGNCEFYLKLAYPHAASATEKFIPLVLSWNVTRKCNLKCAHCYINAATQELTNELNTEEAKNLMDQIAKVSKPLLILSGGEPLLRSDIFELIRYGVKKGFKMGLGSNGSLIDNEIAKNIKEAGVSTISVSLDSSSSRLHDEFRGVKGSWIRAVNAIKYLKNNGLLVQVNTTVTQDNYKEIDKIMSLAENLGVENFHLFFLVPTGRGVKLTDISPKKYEDMIKTAFKKANKHKLNVRPSCAPQFMRIAKDKGLDMRQWIRGCIAGLYYCRIYPNGDITPCPYLPIRLGNVCETTFKEIWFHSNVFKHLRDSDALKGKCGLCEYRFSCGGCRARAYGLSADFIDYCGDLSDPTDLKGDYLAEDPWCIYKPEELS